MPVRRHGHVGGGTTAEVGSLSEAGYTERTPYDDLLRRLLGEQRWALYASDKARIAAAAAITDADRAGIYDMDKLLTRAVTRRPWEDDRASPARSIARLLRYRVRSEAAGKHPGILRQPPAPAPSRAVISRTDRGDSPAPPPDPVAPEPPRPPEPMPMIPYDGTLRRLLGEDRWRQYKAADLPADVADLVSNASAPAGHGPAGQHAPPEAASDAPPPFRRNGRPPEGREGR